MARYLADRGYRTALASIQHEVVNAGDLYQEVLPPSQGPEDPPSDLDGANLRGFGVMEGPAPSGPPGKKNDTEVVPPLKSARTLMPFPSDPDTQIRRRDIQVAEAAADFLQRDHPGISGHFFLPNVVS